MRDTPYCFLQTLPGQRRHDLGPASDPLGHSTETLSRMYVRPLDSLKLIHKLMAGKLFPWSTHHFLGWALLG